MIAEAPTAPGLDDAPAAPVPPDGPARRGPMRWRLALLGAVAVALVGGYLALADDRPDAPSGDERIAASDEAPVHEHAGDPISPDDLARLDAAGYDRLAGPDNMWGYTAPQPGVAPVEGPQLVDDVRAVVAEQGWDDLDVARAAGFARLSEISDPQHWFNRANLDDGRTLDLERPESLVYRTDGTLLAVMYMVPIGEHGPPVTGTDATWHVHAVGLCYGADAMMPTVLASEGTCPAGQRYAPWSGEMLHVWMVGDPLAQRMTER